MISPLEDAVSPQLKETRISASAGSSSRAALTTEPTGSDDAAGKPAEAPPADELPEDFELTPEIIEDEALRNDFMLRLAIVLIALLLACTEIGETPTLVHVKTGEYLSSHGLLPPRTDPFTETVGETPWFNLSWLFDLMSAGTFAVGGAIGLTVLKTLLAGLTFFLFLKTIRRDVPTWWASICGGLALIVCAEQFTIEPQLITLLGLSTTMWILMRWQRGEASATLWGLVPVFILWSNMDRRAFLGLALLMLVTLGEMIGNMTGRNFIAEEAKRSRLWIIVPVSVLAFLVHPFGWQTLLSPANLYGLEYPAWSELLQNAGGSLKSYHPLWNPIFWRNLTLPVIAALVLAATVPVTFALNWRNVTPAHGLLYLGMLGIGLANSHDLAAVSLVFAVLAALDAQEWYAENFRQTYSVELSERVFSVGGRAVTALAFFGLAFLAITGRLLGPDANRLGFGFRQNLTYVIDGLREDLEQTKIPGQGLNFSLRQGDVLIWLDRKPFIDSRLNLFTQGGPESLLAEYRQLLRTWSIQPQKDESQDALNKRIDAILALRKKKLDKYKIAHAVIPLGPRVPQYGLLQTFYGNSNQWRLVRLGSMAGWFYRRSTNEKRDQIYLEKHAEDFLKEAFETPVEDAASQPTLATAPTWTDDLFSLNANKPNSPQTQLAMHCQRLMQDRLILVMQNQARQAGISMPEMFYIIALADLSIRHAQLALQKDPNASMAYRTLGESCEQLGQLEEQVSQLVGSSVQLNRDRRYYQALAAYNQAILADPQGAFPHLELGNLYKNHQRLDLAVREYDRFLEITGVPDAENEAAQEEYERRLRIKKELEKKIEIVQKEIDKHLEQKAPARQLAGFAHQKGCVLLALKLLKQEGELPQNDPFTLMCQLEAGFVDEAYQGLMRLDGQLEAQMKNARVKQFGLPPNPNVRHYIALAALCVGDYDTAIEQWTRQAKESAQRVMLTLMGALPMVNQTVEPVSIFLPLGDKWQVDGYLLGLGVEARMPGDIATPLWNAALCQLEVGRPKKAAELLNRLLEAHPESPYRPLAAFYIGLTTHQPVDLDPPSIFIPVWEGMFAPGPAIAEKPIRE